MHSSIHSPHLRHAGTADWIVFQPARCATSSAIPCILKRRSWRLVGDQKFEEPKRNYLPTKRKSKSCNQLGIGSQLEYWSRPATKLQLCHLIGLGHVMRSTQRAVQSAAMTIACYHKMTSDEYAPENDLKRTRVGVNRQYVRSRRSKR